MLTKKAFQTGIAMLSTCNLEIDKTKLEVWYMICRKNFGDDLFVECCEALCLEHPKFWLAPKEEEMVDPSKVKEFLKNWTRSFKNNCHT